MSIQAKRPGRCDFCMTVYDNMGGSYMVFCQSSQCREWSKVLNKLPEDKRFAFLRCCRKGKTIGLVPKSECYQCIKCNKLLVILKDFKLVCGYEVYYTELLNVYMKRMDDEKAFDLEQHTQLEMELKRQGRKMEKLEATIGEQKEREKARIEQLEEDKKKLENDKVKLKEDKVKLEGQLRMALKACEQLKTDMYEKETFVREKDLLDRCNHLDEVNKEKDELIEKLKEAKEIAEKEAEKKLKEANLEISKLKKKAEKEEKLSRKRTFQETSDPSTSGGSSPKISNKNDNTDSERSTPAVENAEYARPQQEEGASVLCKCKWMVEIPPEEMFTACANCARTCLRKQLPGYKYVQIECKACGPPTINCVPLTQKVIECYCYRQYAISFTRALDEYDELVYTTTLQGDLVNDLQKNYNSSHSLKAQERYLERVREEYPAIGFSGNVLPQPRVTRVDSK